VQSPLFLCGLEWVLRLIHTRNMAEQNLAFASLISRLRSAESGEGWDKINYVDVNDYTSALGLNETFEEEIPFISDLMVPSSHETQYRRTISTISDLEGPNDFQILPLNLDRRTPIMTRESLTHQEKAAAKLIDDISRLKSAESSSFKYELPEYLEKFKREYEAITKKTLDIPIMNLLSPRTRKKISQLPAPNDEEKTLIEKKHKQIGKLDPTVIYDMLSTTTR
jgi:hypothetical protein